MKISKELESVIRRTFEVKKQAINDRESKEKKNYEIQKKKNVLDSETCKNYLHYKKLFEQLVENNHCRYNGNRNNEIDVYYDTYGTQEDSYRNIRDNADADRLSIEQQREALMIKLQYEKNLEVVSSILAEYGIKI